MTPDYASMASIPARYRAEIWLVILLAEAIPSYRFMMLFRYRGRTGSTLYLRCITESLWKSSPSAQTNTNSCTSLPYLFLLTMLQAQLITIIPINWSGSFLNRRGMLVREERMESWRTKCFRLPCFSMCLETLDS